MPNPNGDLIDGSLRLDSDRRLKLELHAGLAAYRELRSVT
jgi:hypothetical protein